MPRIVVRAIFASALRFPTPEDTAYYVGVARNFVDGRGLVSDAIWSFQTPPLEFPRPAFEVWLPLPSLLALPAMALFGPTFDAAKVPAVLVGSLVPVLAWRLAADVAEERGFPVGRARTLALGTGLTAVVFLPLILFGALPDSTMPFATLALAATLLMTRLLRNPPAGSAIRDPRLLGLGVVLGLAALTRNEAAWLALTWVGLAWWSGERGRRIALVAVPAAVALLIFAPWAARDWAVFGNPLPGQALANALSVTGFDIFAWNDPPTLSRYLALGPARLLELRAEGIWHNLVNVLIVPGFPVSLIGLVALPWTGRARALRPLVVVSIVTFLVTSLVFPVATTWGTFLHAAGAIHVLLIVSALLALDGLIARVGSIRGWTRPVAWLGPTLTIASGILFSAGLGDLRRSGRRGRPALRAAGRSNGRHRPAARRLSRPDRHRLPDLAGRGAPPADACPARRVTSRRRIAGRRVPGNPLPRDDGRRAWRLAGRPGRLGLRRRLLPRP